MPLGVRTKPKMRTRWWPWQKCSRQKKGLTELIVRSSSYNTHNNMGDVEMSALCKVISELPLLKAVKIHSQESAVASKALALAVKANAAIQSVDYNHAFASAVPDELQKFFLCRGGVRKHKRVECMCLKKCDCMSPLSNSLGNASCKTINCLELSCTSYFSALTNITLNNVTFGFLARPAV